MTMEAAMSGSLMYFETIRSPNRPPDDTYETKHLRGGLATCFGQRGRRRPSS